MTNDDAQVITKAMSQIRTIMKKYPDGDDTYIGTEVSTTEEEERFFISRLEDLLEIGEPVGVQPWPADDYPFEVYTFLNDVEIHCICTQEDLDRCRLNLPEHLF